MCVTGTVWWRGVLSAGTGKPGAADLVRTSAAPERLKRSWETPGETRARASPAPYLGGY